MEQNVPQLAAPLGFAEVGGGGRFTFELVVVGVRRGERRLLLLLLLLLRLIS